MSTSAGTSYAVVIFLFYPRCLNHNKPLHIYVVLNDSATLNHRYRIKKLSKKLFNPARVSRLFLRGPFIERNKGRDGVDDSLHVSINKKGQLQRVDNHVPDVYRGITTVNGIRSYRAGNRKKVRGLTVDRSNVVISLARMERHIICTQKSTVNNIESADLATVYYISSIIEQGKGS